MRGNRWIMVTDKNIEKYYDECLTNELKNEFRKFESFVPFVGRYYNQGNPKDNTSDTKLKVMFVLESHYVSDYDYEKEKRLNESKFLTLLRIQCNEMSINELNQEFAEKWYECGEEVFEKKINHLKDSGKLDFSYDENDKKWLNTCQILNDDIKDYNEGKSIRRAHLAYMKLAKAFHFHYYRGKTYDKKELANIMQSFAVLNYFQRPSIERGLRIKVTEIDKKNAFNRFNILVEILKPDLVVFVSKQASDCHKGCVKDYHEIRSKQPHIVYFNHPASVNWWKTESKGIVNEFKKLEKLKNIE